MTHDYGAIIFSWIFVTILVVLAVVIIKNVLSGRKKEIKKSEDSA